MAVKTTAKREIPPCLRGRIHHWQIGPAKIDELGDTQQTMRCTSGCGLEVSRLQARIGKTYCYTVFVRRAGRLLNQWWFERGAS